MGIFCFCLFENCDIITPQKNESFFTKKASPSVYLTLSSELPLSCSPRVINNLRHANGGGLIWSTVHLPESLILKLQNDLN